MELHLREWLTDLTSLERLDYFGVPLGLQDEVRSTAQKLLEQLQTTGAENTLKEEVQKLGQVVQEGIRNKRLSKKNAAQALQGKTVHYHADSIGTVIGMTKNYELKIRKADGKIISGVNPLYVTPIESEEK